MSNFSDKMEEAIRTAKETRAGCLYVIAAHYFPNLLDKGNEKGVIKVCPGCGDKGSKFGVYLSKASQYYWGCHNESCHYHFDKLKAQGLCDAIGLISFATGKSKDESKDVYLELAGVPNPRHDLKTSPAKTRKAPPPAETPPVPVPQQPPPAAPPEPAAEDDDAGVEETEPESPLPPNVLPFSLDDPPEAPPPPPPAEPTVWDDLYSRLSLDSGDREDLKRKRGFTRETIEKAGYRSSDKRNRELLAPLLDKWPHALLLAEGIVTRDTNTGRLKINAQLCGLGFVKGTGEAKDDWDWTNPVLIPYFDKDGRVTSIRPHKGGLSGKRFMREHGYEHGFRSTHTRSHLYCNWLFWNRPEKWSDTCVLTEGEHKANALAQCGIPACAVPGIQMPRNNPFLKEMIGILKGAGIKRVIVAYDNEDKSGKPDPATRYEAEVYALYACHVQRKAGIYPSICYLPDDWRVDGKADWDGALAKFKDKAESKFIAALRLAKPYYPQTQLFGVNEHDRTVHCRFNRLVYDPQILTGGDEEEELARLIAKTPEPWGREFRTRDLADSLFKVRGCYYVHQKPPKEVLVSSKTHVGLYERKSDIQRELAAALPEDLEAIAGLQSALAAVKLLIKGRIKDLTDFTISCDFQVRTAKGVVNRLFRFTNRHGQQSDYLQVPSAALSTSTKFREYCMDQGNYNPKIGDKELQELMQDLGTFSAWQEIRELTMLGRDPESGLWIMGDCAYTPNPDLYAAYKPGQEKDVLFADKHHIIWHDGIGYRINPLHLAKFSHKAPPRFFDELGVPPEEVYARIKAKPQQECLEVAKIFLQLCADVISTIGDPSGLLALGTILCYPLAPEILAKYNGHPGLWVHGRASAGKTEFVRFLMQMFGYDPGYNPVMLSQGTTAVALDRALAQYCDILFHVDEFRSNEADRNRISSLRACFNRQPKSKGLMEESNMTRSVQPMTSPIVSGEGVTNDSATLSRFIEVMVGADKRLGTPEEQEKRYQRMLAQAHQYHRIIRYVMLNRKWFAKIVMAALDAFLAAPDVQAAIPAPRMRLSYGVVYCAAAALLEHFQQAVSTAIAAGTLGEFTIAKPDVRLLADSMQGTEHETEEGKVTATPDFRNFTLDYAHNAAADVASINFIVKFWKDVVTFSNIDSSLNRFIFFKRCKIDPDTHHVLISPATEDRDGLVRCVIVKPAPIYSEYERHCRLRGHEPDLSFNNIRSEIMREKYWCHGPKIGTYQGHRFAMRDLKEGETSQATNLWVLRCDQMDPGMAATFAERFEQNAPEEGKGLGF